MNKLPSPLAEIILGVVIFALLIIIFNPFSVYMTQMTAMLLALVFLVLFGLFSLFIFREQPRDEREELLAIKTSRHAFLITGAVTAIGISVQLLQHDVDSWLLIVFAVMIFSKLFAYMYQNKNG